MGESCSIWLEQLGALQFNLTYEKAMEVSDYFKENLQNNHFVNPDQTVYIGLDSGWDCMNEEQLKSFIENVSRTDRSVVSTGLRSPTGHAIRNGR